MRSLFLGRDLWSISALASVLVSSVYWNDFMASYASVPTVIPVFTIIVIVALAVLFGLLIVGSFQRFIVFPDPKESWSINRIFYLAFCFTILILSYAAIFHSGPPAALIITTAGSINVGISLLFWAGLSFAGRTWRKPQKP